MTTETVEICGDCGSVKTAGYNSYDGFGNYVRRIRCKDCGNTEVRNAEA